MGLRLCFQLFARSPVVRDDATMLVDLLRLLDRERLLDETEARITVTYADGRRETSTVPGSPHHELLRQRLSQVAQTAPQSVELDGLRTGDGFPNPFWQYAEGQDVIAAWLRVEYTAQPSSERRFALVFLEPQLLSDTPAFPPAHLAARLKTIVATTLEPECVTVVSAAP